MALLDGKCLGCEAVEVRCSALEARVSSLENASTSIQIAQTTMQTSQRNASNTQETHWRDLQEALLARRWPAVIRILRTKLRR